MGRLRSLFAAVLAVGVTFGLFLFMYTLISSGAGGKGELEAISGIRFGPAEIPDEAVTRSRQIPRKPPPPRSPPPPPKMEVAKAEARVSDMHKPSLPRLDLPLVGGEGMFIGEFGRVDRTGEGDIIPIVVIRPMYPREAAINGIEGWVRVEFTILPDGTVRDPRVIDADPPLVFNREALRAILKWKFKPRVVEGMAVERLATQTIEFHLEQG